MDSFSGRGTAWYIRFCATMDGIHCTGFVARDPKTPINKSGAKKNNDQDTYC